MNNRGRLMFGVAMGATLAMVGTASVGQQAQVFAYPSAGQSQEQQSKDRFECHQWAVSQTGFDPTTAAPVAAAPPPAYGYSDQPPPPPPQGQSSTFLGIGNGGALKGTGMVGDAVTGAALGAAGGALGGDAGEGAAIGALATTLFGAVARSSSNSQPPPAQAAPPPQQYQPQADPAYQDRMRRSGEYNAAFGACMKARNYMVN